MPTLEQQIAHMKVMVDAMNQSKAIGRISDIYRAIYESLCRLRDLED